MSLRIPPGTALILAGSGLYWILSSQLISSFTVLAPGAFDSTSLGTTLVLVVGIISSAAGLWIIGTDFDELDRLFSRRDGWIFTIPIILVTLDIYLTLLGLSSASKIVELNPLVAGAVQIGASAMVPFVLSYIALSEGLALLMLRVGRWLFGESGPAMFLPFAFICGAASFGPASNFALLALPEAGTVSYWLGAVVSGGVSLSIYMQLKKKEVFAAGLFPRLASYEVDSDSQHRYDPNDDSND